MSSLCDVCLQAWTSPAGSVERLAHVAAFSMTAYSGLYRDNKPFFSLMGETYEFVCPEKGIRVISEKVMHPYEARHRGRGPLHLRNLLGGCRNLVLLLSCRDRGNWARS
jgi:hypothetical protein